jgi:phosphatidylserine/phosphatidylglycerophosphate/cardiolipin synthase-like enzyme
MADQLNACERWAHEHGASIIARYEGVTANDVNPQLVADLRSGKFDVLITDIGPENYTRSASRYRELLAAATEGGVEVYTTCDQPPADQRLAAGLADALETFARDRAAAVRRLRRSVSKEEA